jgi:hypothetical protein
MAKKSPRRLPSLPAARELCWVVWKNPAGASEDSSTASWIKRGFDRPCCLKKCCCCCCSFPPPRRRCSERCPPVQANIGCRMTAATLDGRPVPLPSPARPLVFPAACAACCGRASARKPPCCASCGTCWHWIQDPVGPPLPEAAQAQASASRKDASCRAAAEQQQQPAAAADGRRRQHTETSRSQPGSGSVHAAVRDSYEDEDQQKMAEHSA